MRHGYRKIKKENGMKTTIFYLQCDKTNFDAINSKFIRPWYFWPLLPYISFYVKNPKLSLKMVSKQLFLTLFTSFRN